MFAKLRFSELRIRADARLAFASSCGLSKATQAYDRKRPNKRYKRLSLSPGGASVIAPIGEPTTEYPMSRKPINPMIAETGNKRRWIAFLKTSAAVFTLCCLIWPLSVSGFRTSSTMLVNGEGKTPQDLESELSAAVRAQMNDENLEKFIQLIEDSDNLRSRAIEYRDFQTIRESVRIGHVESDLGPTLKIAYEGNGGDDERQLVNLISNRVYSELHGSTGNLVASQSKIERFKQAEWLIDQMAEDLESVQGSLAQMN